MLIGNLELGHLPLFLAPMEDVTYKSFRYLCKKHGADVMYTEFIASEALIRDVTRTKRKMTIFDFDRPLAIQIYGSNIESMVEAGGRSGITMTHAAAGVEGVPESSRATKVMV